jgi:hypothetical protein
VLRLELHKRSRANRRLILVTSATVVVTTVWVMAFTSFRLSQEGSPQNSLHIYAGQLFMQCLSCYILNTEVGVLPPLALESVPPVALPMHWWSSLDSVLSRVLKFTFLTDEEILGLPHNLPELEDRFLSRDIARYVRACVRACSPSPPAHPAHTSWHAYIHYSRSSSVAAAWSGKAAGPDRGEAAFAAVRACRGGPGGPAAGAGR